MNDVKSSSSFSYGRKLVNAGISGVRTGHQEFDPEKASSLVTSSAEEAIRLALAGACLGVVPAVLLARRSRAANAFVFGVAGGVLGFLFELFLEDALFDVNPGSLGGPPRTQSAGRTLAGRSSHRLRLNPGPLPPKTYPLNTRRTA